MKSLLWFLIALCVGGCSPVSIVNALVPRGGFELAAAMPYGPLPRQALDVYRPAGAQQAPVVVFFYGGSWQRGGREDFLFVAEALTSRGYVVVIPDYRLYPEVRYPGFIEDGAAAVTWTAANIARFGGDPNRIVLMGHSAGAHIAAMLATNRRYIDGDLRRRLVAFVGLAGPYDFVPTDPDIKAALEGEGDSRRAMPTTYVQGGEPPMLLVTGGRDTTVGLRNAELMEAALRRVGSPVERYDAAALNHVTIVGKLAAPLRDDALLEVIDRFMKRRIAEQPRP